MNINDWQAHVGDLEAICNRLGKEIARNKALIPRVIVSCLTGVFVVGSFGFFALYVMEKGILLDQFQFGNVTHVFHLCISKYFFCTEKAKWKIS